MDAIVVYSSKNSPRLKYVLDWLLKERLQIDYIITQNKQEAENASFCISYGEPVQRSLSIPDEGLLWQTRIEDGDKAPGKWGEIPVFFSTEKHDHTLSFDLFSALFFLLSRYEEYCHYTPDKHDRYPATSSILYKQGWLSRPIADEWVEAFRKKIQSLAGESLAAPPYHYQPSYDIDMAYAHLHKGVARIVGAYARAFVKLDLSQISERILVFKKKQKDPYDSFRWLRQLHGQYDRRPLYFILSAEKTSAFDKNIHPGHPAMMRIIRNLAKEGDIGLHPSYYSDKKDMLAKEKALLEQVAGQKINISRQHYIKMKMPDTYRLLLRQHINADYSMGYGTHLGFRAGTGSSFLWYDVEQETTTPLRIYPFCFMDTTARFEQKLSASQAFEKLHEMNAQLMRCGSTLTTIFHNFSLGTAAVWKGWRQVYEDFLQENKSETVKEYNNIDATS